MPRRRPEARAGRGEPLPFRAGAQASASTARQAIREYLPAQPGDVPDTFADTARLEAATGWRPSTPVEEGVRRFAAWFRAWRAVEAEA